MIFIVATLFLLIFKLLLAGKDATSYLLKDKNVEGSLTDKRIDRWHRDGVLIDILNTVAVSDTFGGQWWQIFVISLLLRLSVYDLAFNHWSKLSLTYLGGSALSDRIFCAIFGKNGAIQKSIVFFILLVLFIISKSVFNY